MSVFGTKMNERMNEYNKILVETRTSQKCLKLIQVRYCPHNNAIVLYQEFIPFGRYFNFTKE